ncbi:MAG TPA: ferritin-like domain-containing protein [Anaerolineae bacterium]|nr:ferritin-like domain-containing protein [Anaerolineae bacterium]
MHLNNLRDLFEHELHDLYDAEGQIIEALPKMAETASSPDLQRAFRKHLDQTRSQRDRLEQTMRQLGVQPNGVKCKGMEGLIREGQELMRERGNPDVMDAALIGAAQKVEHYEMAGYGTARTFARVLGETQAAGVLQQILDEEGNTDKELTMLAESRINREARR